MESSKKWTDLLTKCNVFVPLGKKEFHWKCPFHDDQRDSLSINIEKGVWICFAGCGQGSLRSFVSRFSDTLYFETDFDEDLLSYSEEFLDFSTEYNEIQLPETFVEQQYPNWVFDRGFTKKTLREWKCRLNPTTNSLIIPAYTKENILIGWVARRPPQQEPRYLYPEFFKKSSILFGQNMNTSQHKILCLVEGPLDALWLYQHGYFACALLGAHLSVRQFQLLARIGKEIGEIVLCLDNDKIGQTTTAKIVGELRRNSIVSTISLPVQFKDVQDVRDSALLMRIIEHRSEFNL